MFIYSVGHNRDGRPCFAMFRVIKNSNMFATFCMTTSTARNFAPTSAVCVDSSTLPRYVFSLGRMRAIMIGNFGLVCILVMRDIKLLKIPYMRPNHSTFVTRFDGDTF